MGAETIDLEKFETRASWGGLELQLSFGMVLFFGRGMDVYGKQVLALWQDFLGWRGREAFTWARLGGGNKNRKMDAAAYRTVEGWLSGAKPSGKTCWIEVHGGEYEQLGPHSFAMVGLNPPDDDVSVVDVRLPVAVAGDGTADDLVERLCGLAGRIDFICGTAGLMLQALPWQRELLWPAMKSLVVRYEGVEPDIVEDGQWTAELGLPGINWLTFVGPKYLGKLGGAAALKATASKCPDVTVYDVGKGLALRAGEWPTLGDRNLGPRASGVAAYRDVYRIVKPAIFADYKYPFDRDYFDGDETVAWVHRFGRS